MSGPMKQFALALVATLMLAVPVRAEIQIQQVTSAGGITAWLVEDSAIPFTALEIRFKGGAALDAPGKRGAINLMTALLEEGAGDLDAQAFATAQESLAASYEFDVYGDALSISAQFLTENRDAAVALLRSAIMEPRFDADAIERVRAQVISIIKSDQKDPNRIASRAFDALAFGDHPYGSSRNGTVESVSALTQEDLFDAKARTMARDRLYVGAVGDIDAETLGKLLDDLLGDLPAAGAPMPPRAELGLTGGVTIIPFDTPQSVAVFGHGGLKRDDPDFFAAYVMNQILGGSGFTSRLMEEVREKRGLTYGVYSYLVPMNQAELVQGQVASANDRIGEAIQVIRAEWARIVEEGVSEQELRDAKTFLTGAYPLRFDGNGPIANIMVGMQMQELPIDYIATRNAKVEAVTRDDILRVARRVLDPEGLRFVVVGQPVGLAAEN